MDKKLINASKFMSLLLRHKPDTIGLELDECGWANINELIDLSSSNGKQLDKALIERVVSENDKQRFSISEDGCFVRANQGHSFEVNLNLEVQQPPEILFHGTASRFINSIKEQGLVKMNRQHVHLSALEATAVSVGKRHGKPVVLKVEADKMQHDGHVFYLSKNGVWLTDEVPVKYINLICM